MVFSRGVSLVYRWASMKSKRDAEKKEKKLLGSFDYAWNKGSNGPRCVDDILQKLNSSTSSADQCSFYVNLESDDTLFGILKFGRSRPTLVSIRLGVKEDKSNICGVALGQGSVCVRPPVEGRKRCARHKGMRVGSSAAKLITEGKPRELYAGMGSKLDGHQNQKFNYSKFKILPAADKKSVIDGTRTKTPVHRRERCEEHKGKKIPSSVSKSVSEEEEHYEHGPILEARTHLSDYGYECAVDLKNGRCCTSQPVVGGRRCEEHKGVRVKEQKSKLKRGKYTECIC